MRRIYCNGFGLAEGGYLLREPEAVIIVEGRSDSIFVKSTFSISSNPHPCVPRDRTKGWPSLLPERFQRNAMELLVEPDLLHSSV